MMVDQKILAVENTTLCAACKGECCKRAPGHLHPSDVGHPPTVSAIVALLQTGQYTVDWWKGDPREGCDELGKAYYLRVAAVNDHGPRTGSWGGECVLLRKDGCVLSLEGRPMGCRTLKPIDKWPECACGFSKEESCIAWIPYQDVIEAALAVVES